MFEEVQAWVRPPIALAMPDNEVHIWQCKLDPAREVVARLERTLSEDERGRARRFHFAIDRTRFIVARGVLRSILGRYLAMAPSGLEFCYSALGKPVLTGFSGVAGLDFNVAHSQGMALYAVTIGRRIGVDLEKIRPIADAQQVAARHFSARECAVFQQLPEAQKLGAFFRCWTRKEAYLKATGEGLSLPLDRFDVSLAPGEPAALLSVAGRPSEAALWLMQDVPVGPDYAAAVAVAGSGWHRRCYAWEVK